MKTMTYLLAALAFHQAAPSPYLLPLGAKGQTTVAMGAVVDLRDGHMATAADIARAARHKPFVFLGESHTSPEHHRMQARVIEALVRDGRNVVVGFEMFTRPKQDSLDPWTLGHWDEATFLRESEWKTQWGFPFELYRPIFTVVRENQIPMVALNVPRTWVRAVGKGGYEALKPEERSQLPTELFLGDSGHHAVFDSLMGGHPTSGPSGEHMYAAQVLWDEGMADTAIKYLQSRVRNDKSVFVVIAGSGHVMYKRGINLRIARRTKMDGITLTMIDGDGPTPVSNGIGDFVYLSPTPKGS